MTSATSFDIKRFGQVLPFLADLVYTAFFLIGVLTDFAILAELNKARRRFQQFPGDNNNAIRNDFKITKEIMCIDSIF